MSKQEQFWRGKGGHDYHARNWVDWTERQPFWHKILMLTSARSVLEFGCGPGWNLSAIKRMQPWVKVVGTEINDEAQDIATDAGIELTDSPYRAAELVFTAGCLIHIPPDEIHETMLRLVYQSYKYVLCIEYESTEEEEIEYRGESGLLWKRPYRQMYEDLGLTEIAYGRVGKDDGFDDCIWGLMSK